MGSPRIGFDGDDPRPAHAADGEHVAFHGRHQAGIVTAVQDRLHFASFDLLECTTRAERSSEDPEAAP